MLDRAKAGAFAYPAINVSSSQTLNAALRGFAEAGSDGIIQVSTGGADYLSGPTIKNMVSARSRSPPTPTRSLRTTGERRPAHRPLPADKLDGFVRPLLALSADRVKRGEAPLFSRTCGTGSPCRFGENLAIAKDTARPDLGRAHRAGDRGRRGRRRGGRRRGRHRREALTPPSRTAWPWSRRSASASRAATWPR